MLDAALPHGPNEITIKLIGRRLSVEDMRPRRVLQPA
jgi:hypothetical protein